MPAITYIDANLYNYCTPRQREVLEAIELHGGAKAASIALGINQGAASDAYIAVKKKAALRGYAPEKPLEQRQQLLAVSGP